jgi:hypothetical protein
MKKFLKEATNTKKYNFSRKKISKNQYIWKL